MAAAGRLIDIPPDDDFVALVQGLPPPLRALAARGRPMHFRKQELIIREGSRGDELFFLLRGRVRAFSTDAHQREISFAIDHAGEYFGEMVLDGGPRSASVEALEPTLCSAVPGAVVWDHIRNDPEFTRALIERLIGRARWTTERARELALFDVYGRLRLLLEQIAAPPNAAGERPVVEHLTHQAIASRLGSSREMVSRLMKDLEKGGYIRTARASVTLLKPLPERW